jgi:peroxiredoxin
MVRTESEVCDFGWKAAGFDLPGVDGKRHTPASARGPNGLLVMFICNHCPYVKAVIDKIVRDCGELAQHGVGSIAIMSNDPTEYPEDSFDNMVRVAREKRFPFPYVLDESQAVAKAYGAQCTPDFFGFNAQARAAVPRSPGLVRQAVAAGGAARALRRHGRGGEDRPGAEGADALDRLLDQVEVVGPPRAPR